MNQRVMNPAQQWLHSIISAASVLYDVLEDDDCTDDTHRIIEQLAKVLSDNEINVILDACPRCFAYLGGRDDEESECFCDSLPAPTTTTEEK